MRLLVSLMVASVCTAPLHGQESAPPLQAPYQLEGVLAGGTEIGDASTQILVGMGRAPDPETPDAGGPVPDSDTYAWMTVLGTDGWVLASLVSLERRCEFLCSYDGPQECHWVGLYSPHGSLESVGTVLAAAPGRLQIEEFTPLGAATPGDPSATLEVGGEPGPLLWEPWADWSYSVSAFDPEAGTLELQYESTNGQTGVLDGSSCTNDAREWLLTVDCGLFTVLASGGRPLLVSQADYNSPATEVFARFDYGGSRHYVVRFGAKAQDVVGLVSGEPAGWRARFRPRDWAALC